MKVTRDEAKRREYQAKLHGAHWDRGEWSKLVHTAKENNKHGLPHLLPELSPGIPPLRAQMFPAGTVGVRPDMLLGAEEHIAALEGCLAAVEDQMANKLFVWTVQQGRLSYVDGPWTVVAAARDADESRHVAAVILSRCPTMPWDRLHPDRHTTSGKIEFCEWFLKNYADLPLEVGRGGLVLDPKGNITP